MVEESRVPGENHHLTTSKQLLYWHVLDLYMFTGGKKYLKINCRYLYWYCIFVSTFIVLTTPGGLKS